MKRQSQPKRSDKVEDAYHQLPPKDQEAFRVLIQDENRWGHASIATALHSMGFPVDRKQVHNYREKLRLGRVTLEPVRPPE